MKQILIIILLITTFLQGGEEIYFLPKDGNKAEKRISKLFYKAHQNIKIAMYSFTNKKFLKALKSAARRGVKIQIVADYGSNKNMEHRSIVPILKGLRNIEVKYLNGIGKGRYKGIMHIKLFIIDKRVVAFGSANATYSAYHKNYELLYVNDNWTFTRKFLPIFEEVWKKGFKK